MNKKVLGFILIFIQIIHSELIQVIELFRHGARGPIYQYYDWKQQEEIIGELTEGGMRQHFELGRALRQEYIHNQKFLSEHFNHTEINIFSTDKNRTIQSAQSQLLGLYPFGTGPEIQDRQDIPDTLLYPPYKDSKTVEFLENSALPKSKQVFPIHTVRNQDLFLSNYCPLQEELIKENYETYDKIYKDIQLNLSPLMKQFSQILSEYHDKDITIKNTQQLWDIYDNFMSNKFQERQLPKEVTDEVYKKLQFAASFEWLLKYGSGKFNKILSTEFFNFLLTQFQSKIDNKDNLLRFIMLSAHDTNIVKVLAALKLITVECVVDLYNGIEVNGQCLDIPTYASQLIFELHKEHSKFYIKLKYQGRYVKILGGQEQVEFQKFEEFLKNEVLVENAYKECGFVEVENEMKDDLITLEKQEEHKSEIYDIIIAFQSIGIVVIGILMYYKSQQLKEYKEYLKQERSQFQN